MTTSQKDRLFILFQCLAALAAAASVCYGIVRGELPLLFKKAVRICMECIGLG
ncbi:MAG: hypothetical protein K6G18_06960 [Treponema sp.]|nr:hypothetical protein [Treponema sp.]